jgi:hypothetical protein
MAETTKIVQYKTLPIKYKHILYSMYGLIEQLQQKSILDEESIQKCLDVLKPIVFMKPTEQVTFLDEFIDVQHIETNIVKEMIVKKRKTDRDAEMAQKKAEKVVHLTPEMEKRNIDKLAEKVEKAELKEKEKVEKAELKEKEKVEKAELKEKEKVEKAQLKEKEKTEKAQLKEKEKVEKIEKAGLKENEKVEKVEKAGLKENEKVEKVEKSILEETVEKVEKSTLEETVEKVKNATLEEKTGESDSQMRMRVINDIKYWIYESDLNNGPIYENTTDDNEDSTNGNKVGELKHGVVFLDNIIEPKKTKKIVKKTRKTNTEAQSQKVVETETQSQKVVETETETETKTKTKTKGRKPMKTETRLEGSIDIPTDYDEFSLKEVLDFKIDEIFPSMLDEEFYIENNTTTKIKINQ